MSIPQGVRQAELGGRSGCLEGFPCIWRGGRGSERLDFLELVQLVAFCMFLRRIAFRRAASNLSTLKDATADPVQAIKACISLLYL